MSDDFDTSFSMDDTSFGRGADNHHSSYDHHSWYNHHYRYYPSTHHHSSSTGTHNRPFYDYYTSRYHTPF